MVKISKSDRERCFVIAGREIAAPNIAGGLYLVATPIGNLGDVSLRALGVLSAAEMIACEDTRVTRKLTEHYGIGTALTPYHEHNAAEARPRILARLAAGEAVALVSDAGTPLISDPGYKLVREAAAAGHAVTTVPGASAVLSALSISALPTDRFFFEGFLPPREVARQKRILELTRIPATLVLFATGPRITATLTDLAEILGPREAAICRELTKLHEEIRRAPLDQLAREYRGGAETRGEFVIVIAPPQEQIEIDIDAMLRDALARVSVKDAVGEVALASGRSKRAVYQRALELVQEADDGAPR